MGQATYYSRDGYGWSAQHIEHDVELPQVPRGMFRQRVYHGDLVRLPARAGAQEYTVMAVLVRGQSIWLWQSETDEVSPLEQAWPPPSSPRIKEIVGSMYANPAEAAHRHYILLVDGSGSAVPEGQFWPCLTMVTGLSVCIGLQLL